MTGACALLRALRLLLLLAGVAVAWSADDLDLPGFQIEPYDKVYLLDGPVHGHIEQIDQETGTVLFRRPDAEQPVTFLPAQYTRIVHKSLPADIIRKRARILLEAPRAYESEIMRTLEHGREWAQKYAAEEPERAERILVLTREFARDAAQKYAGNERLALEAIELLLPVPSHHRALEQIIRAVFANQRVAGFEAGYVALEQIYRVQNRTDQLYELAQEWVDDSRSSLPGNRLLAGLAERRGDWEQARDAYSRLYNLRADDSTQAGVALARSYYRLGNLARAAEVAQELLDAGHRAPDCLAITGTALLKAGGEERLPKAHELLRTANEAGVSAGLRIATRYNLGLTHYRLGDRTAARRTWSRLDHPAARLGVAQCDRRPIKDVDALPAGLQPVARELNACLLLERGNAQGARRFLADHGGLRHTFLSSVADLLDENGSLSTVERLGYADTRESQRWQLYGHIRAGRFDRARELIERMPENDGYAAVTQVYLAAVAKKEDEARELYRQALRSDDPPRGYLERIGEQYAEEQDVIRIYDFSEWPAGYALRDGWGASSEGTGILTLVDQGALVMRGKQLATRDPVCRVWTTTDAQSLRRVSCGLDLGRVGTAIVGIEVTDERRHSGIGYGVQGDGVLAYRVLSEQTWGPWRRLRRSVSGLEAHLRLEFDHRRSDRIAALIDGDRVRLEADVTLGTGEAVVGFFGYAEPGEEWELRIKRLLVQLRGDEPEQPDHRRGRRR